MLETLIEHERVHRIASWDELKDRLGRDRRWLRTDIQNAAGRTADLLEPQQQIALWELLQDGTDGGADAASSPEADRVDTVRELEGPLSRLCAAYLVKACRPDGLPRDPVARFHVRAGASVERICPLGDPSPEGMASSLGFMVNYRYDPSHISANERTMQRGEDIPASWQVRRLAESGLGSLLFWR